MTPTCRTSSIGPILLLILVLAWCGDVIQAAEGQLFSDLEGGSFPVQNEEGGGSAQASTTADFFAPGTDYVEGAEEYQQPNQYQTKSFPANAEREILMEQQRQRLANIVEQLRRQSEYTPQELANGPGVFVDEEDEDAAHQRNRNIANEWERLREDSIKNQPKIRKKIEILLNKGRALRAILNEKCKTDGRYEQLWEAFVEEGNDLRDLMNKPQTLGWKVALVEHYSVYVQLIRIAQRVLRLVGGSEEWNLNDVEKARSKSAYVQYKDAKRVLDKALMEGASGESGELSKKHKLSWLRKLNHAVNDFENTTKALRGKQMGGETEKPEFAAANNDQKMAAVKKGQSEFVEFVEPHQGNRIKANEWMEKRAPFDSEHSNPFNFFANSGNILFMAYLAICCVGITAGTIGGVYYYNHVRASRNDGDPFNEFTRYSPAGPGKDKLKKGTGSPTFQSGDDTLAYKAQLQHYQQQKQKILGSAPGQVVESVSDNEEDNDEMDHNYSVFECPGLAPTGDLEIQNPNFVGGEKQAEQHRD